MYDENEPERLLVGNAVEDEHRLDGEMPRTSTIGRWHDDGEVGYHKGNQRTADTKFRCEVEAEECQVVMQEIHHPDADGEEQV